MPKKTETALAAGLKKAGITAKSVAKKSKPKVSAKAKRPVVKKEKSAARSKIVVGKLNPFFADKGYGFINPKGGDPKDGGIFVHISGFKGIKRPRIGGQYSCTPIPSDRKQGLLMSDSWRPVV